MAPQMGVPGNSVVVGSENQGSNCPGAQLLTTKVFTEAGCKEPLVADGRPGAPCVGRESYDRRVYVGCAAQVIRSGMVRTTQSYCTTTSQYLRRRGRSVDQCDVFAPKNVDSSGDSCPYNAPVIKDDEDAARVLATPVVCQTGCLDAGKMTRYYKPSNRNFACQGAVSSSSLVDRRKQEALYGNAKSYCDTGHVQSASAQMSGVANPGGMMWKMGGRIACHSAQPKVGCTKS